ncbi:nitrate reductase delta subunit [Rheinheimera pacifica]|uniref:nitrate reductase molybdenum cofactor assembly chaperone n=1 Tax=Rheinheimera pacifica TaxID=173990 RepID=UPI002854E2B1|nr:nitrate reductase molybdenum cofactor assembly chaperone [Rheinheimera pacifica]MDR6983533.1 nitrate reductase delta subunit [Rheinheimera pacifica]
MTIKSMPILQLLSLLLDYPKQPLLDAKAELLAIVADAAIAAELKQQLNAFITARCSGELMDWQSEYDGLFERGRSLSLLIFEHIHGESRDRGQAMVNLMAQYREAGLDIGVKELPDYLPLYLEFLSTQGQQNAQIGLEEIAPVLAVLLCRLQQRESDYAGIFATLVALSAAEVDLADIKAQIAGEQRDDTPKALDKVWEEEMVSFIGNEQANSACGSGNKPTDGQRRDQFIPLSTELLGSEEAGQQLYQAAAAKRT